MLETKQVTHRPRFISLESDRSVDGYEDLWETLEGIELPARFTAKQIVEKYKEYEAKTPKLKELNERIYKLNYNIALNEYLLHRDFTSPQPSKKFHEHLWGYLESLNDFYKFVKESLKEDRIGITVRFLTTDLPHEYFTLLNLSNHTEEISTEAILYVIEETKAKIGSITTLGVSDLKQRFKFSVDRAGRKRIRRILEDTFKKIDDIFKFTGDMEKSRYALSWFINIWNCKDEKDLPFPDEITFKNLPENHFRRYMDIFREELQSCRNFLIINYYDVFKRMRMVDDELTQKSWNSLIDTLIYSEA